MWGHSGQIDKESFKASNKGQHSETIILVLCGPLAGREVNKITSKYENDPNETNL